MENLDQASRSHDATGKPGDITIPVIEEKISFGKKIVETGKVTASKTVEEQTVAVSEQLTQEHVTVERKPYNQYVEVAPPAVAHKGDTTIISVVKEVLVVEKRLMLVEEIHITKKRSEHIYSEDITLRQEKIEISRSRSGTDI